MSERQCEQTDDLSGKNRGEEEGLQIGDGGCGTEASTGDAEVVAPL